MADNTDNDCAEIWKPVLGYEDFYEVSSLGRVRSLDRYSQFDTVNGQRARLRRGKIRPPQRTGNYFSVAICLPNQQAKGRTVHSLVCEAFHGPRPDGMQVSHLNGDGRDNRPENLVWETPKANTGRQAEHGTAAKGERNANAILNEDSVIAIRELRKAGMARKQIARAFSVTEHCIADVLQGRSWKGTR